MQNKMIASKLSYEVRERALRQIQGRLGGNPLQQSAIELNILKIVCVPQTFYKWVRRHEVEPACVMTSPVMNATS